MDTNTKSKKEKSLKDDRLISSNGKSIVDIKTGEFTFQK